jgi:hypothetical protein
VDEILMTLTGSAAKLAGSLGIAMLAVGGTVALTPSTPAAQVDVQKLGPQAGTKVPDFTLSDQQGQPRTLRSVMGPKGALLVFFRSADW